jgi:hypothetical protein
MTASNARAGFVTPLAFNNNTPAVVSFNDGVGDSGTVSTLLSQLNVSYSTGGPPVTFNTFSIDLLHTVSLGQTYAVNSRADLATAFANGSRIAFVFQSFGLPDLTSNPVQAAAVQIALWDLSLNNHNPTTFAMDPGGTYSSGDPDVFKVDLGGNPSAAQIAGLVNQYLGASVGATGPGRWLDASVGGAGSPHGPSVVEPTPEPSSLLQGIMAIGCLSAWGLRRMGRRGTIPINS